MDSVKSSRRSDDQLDAMLCETGHWVVNGQQGRVLCFAPSLRRALDRSANYAASGAVVVAICRLPTDNIIVLPAQIDRLRKIITDRERLPGTEPRPEQRRLSRSKIAANDIAPVATHSSV